jgi:hypothetical protein
MGKKKRKGKKKNAINQEYRGEGGRTWMWKGGLLSKMQE